MPTADLSLPTGAEPPALEARERILQTAFRLFGRQGYARTSVQDIAAGAGVKKPVLYYYFGSKEGLYRALVTESTRLLRHFLEEAARSAGGPAEPVEQRLGRLAETILGLARDNRDPVRFFFAHFFAADEDRPLCNTEEFEQAPPRVIRLVAEEAIARGEIDGSADDLERLIVGAVQLSIIKHLRHPQEEPLLPGLGQRLVRATLRGFTPPRRPAAS